jgi:hypothetical protein
LVGLVQYLVLVLALLVVRTLGLVAVVAVLVALAATAAPVLSSSVLHARTHLLLVRLRSVAHQQGRTQVVAQISLSTRSIRRAR